MKILVIDVETLFYRGAILPYDIGYIIYDTRKEKILCKRSFGVYELLVTENQLLKNAYYKEKIPSYWDEIKEGKRILWGFSTIKKCIYTDIKNNSVQKIYAYNANFDINALNHGNKYFLNCEEKFFPDYLQFCCIWNMSCQIICTQNYFKFCKQYNFFSEKGNIKTSAEIIYKFIKKDENFVEEHKGLEDVKIELEILLLILKRKKKVDSSINTVCYKKVQENFLIWEKKKEKRKKK